MGRRKVTHGMSHAPLGTRERRTYRAWQLLRQRCQNKNAPDYDRYGGRGISVDDRWNRFEHFLTDVGLAPTSEHTIDRVESSKGYTPGNVRWATRLEQQSNLRSNRRIKFNGLNKTCAEWARLFGISRQCLYQRLKRLPDQDALDFYLHKTRADAK